MQFYKIKFLRFYRHYCCLDVGHCHLFTMVEKLSSVSVRLWLKSATLQILIQEEDEHRILWYFMSSQVTLLHFQGEIHSLKP